MFGLNDDLIRASVAYHQSTLQSGPNRRLAEPLTLAVRRTIGALCIRIGAHLQGDATTVPGAATPARLALP